MIVRSTWLPAVLAISWLIVGSGCGQPRTGDEIGRDTLDVARDTLDLSEDTLNGSPDIRQPDPAQHQQRVARMAQDERVGLWGTDDQAMWFRFLREVDVDDAESLVDAFNEEYSGAFYPGLDYAGVEGRTLTVRVRDPRQLGNAMGTTGAVAYMGTATLTFTSLPEIDSVYFDFGDVDPDELAHARPGTTSREMYVDRVEDDSLP